MTTFYYSAATGGLYNSDEHPVLPPDAGEISSDLRDQLISGNALGQIIVAGANGLPMCVSRESTMSDADLTAELRCKRDALLAACDWITLRALEKATAVPDAWITYRQALRDLPTSAGWPRSVTFPPAPAQV